MQLAMKNCRSQRSYPMKFAWAELVDWLALRIQMTQVIGRDTLHVHAKCSAGSDWGRLDISVAACLLQTEL